MTKLLLREAALSGIETDMLILGIESSCDETSAAVVEEQNGVVTVRSNIVASQIETHRLYGGVVPEIASRAHIEAICPTVRQALDDAGVTPQELDAVAVTSHPGLIGALLVGVNFAKSFAYAWGKTVVPVNHVHAHTAAAYLAVPGLKPPFLSLVVSGGHTSFYHVESFTRYRELGGTRDDAAGEAFDKIGRVIGLPYPGGAAMDKLACEGDTSELKKEFRLPSPALAGDNLDFSFSGLKTAALNLLNGKRQRGEELAGEERAAFASAYTEAIVSAIISKIPAALAVSGCKRLVIAGGVAANSHLREAAELVCHACGAELILPSMSLCGDNAAMVAAEGAFLYLSGVRGDTSLNARADDGDN